MKNNLNFFQVAQRYVEELGTEVDTTIIESYLKTVFERKINKEKLEEFDIILSKTITTNSEYFPEFNTKQTI